jgi:hypothetical protein
MRMDLKKLFGRAWTELICLKIWIDLVEDRDQQWDLVKSVMNLLVQHNARKFCLAENF